MDYPIKTPSQLGMILQALRKERRETQRSVAAHGGLLQKTVSLLERSPERATVNSLLALVAALDAEIVLRPRNAGPDEIASANSASVPEW